MSVTMNPKLAAEQNARYKRLMIAAAAAGSELLRDNLSSTTHGAGVHWPTLPHRSSATGQMPVKQTGALADGVGMDDGDTQTGAKIIIEDDLEKLVDLEFAPPGFNPNQPTLATRDTGGRSPMWLTFSDPDTHRVMNDEMRRT